MLYRHYFICSSPLSYHRDITIFPCYNKRKLIFGDLVKMQILRPLLDPRSWHPQAEDLPVTWMRAAAGEPSCHGRAWHLCPELSKGSGPTAQFTNGETKGERWAPASKCQCGPISEPMSLGTSSSLDEIFSSSRKCEFSIILLAKIIS